MKSRNYHFVSRDTNTRPALIYGAFSDVQFKMNNVRQRCKAGSTECEGHQSTRQKGDFKML